MLRFFGYLARHWLWGVLSMLLAGVVALGLAFVYLNAQLPDTKVLAHVQLQVPLRVYSSDHLLIATFGSKRRIPLRLDQVPPLLVKAVLETEDRRYYEHPGIDLIGIMRAAKAVISSGKKVQGASTITMQVARNFFLTRKKTYARKITEILLALKIDREFSKQKILELYLNKVYLGNRAYGVAAAAQVYYGKPLNKLSLAEMAMIGGLPQAPSSDNPLANPKGAMERRNHVLERMFESGSITQAAYQQALDAPLTAQYHAPSVQLRAPYVAEAVRQRMVRQYGKERAYNNGFVVTTAIDSKQQQAAQTSLAQGLIAYTERHGYLGPLTNWMSMIPPPSVQSVVPAQAAAVSTMAPKKQVQAARSTAQDPLQSSQQTPSQEQNLSQASVQTPAQAQAQLQAQILTTRHRLWLKALQKLPRFQPLQPAVVWQVQPQSVQVLTAQDQLLSLPWQGLAWARQRIWPGFAVGALPQQASDIVQLGDVVEIRQVNAGSAKAYWRLSQIPRAQSALVALDPQNGNITALVGGFNFYHNKFNRVTQALRQPGSVFKPFIYSAALAQGYTLADTINDAPVVESDSGENPLWRPHNANLQFAGPTRLMVGLSQSRNLVSIRLLKNIGVNYAIEYSRRFGFDPQQLPHSLSLALGTASLSPLQIATAYAVFANGGFRVMSHLITQITSQQQPTATAKIMQMACNTCLQTSSSNLAVTHVPVGQAPQTIPADNAFLMSHALKNIIRHGTGRAALKLKRNDLAGKTGSTNKKVDAWFAGFNRNLVAVVWVGNDDFKPLGEYGAQAALPIWIDFMRQALANTPPASLPKPRDIITMRIDPQTGLQAAPGQGNALFEMFRRQYAPKQTRSNGVGSRDPFAAGANIANQQSESASSSAVANRGALDEAGELQQGHNAGPGIANSQDGGSNNAATERSPATSADGADDPLF